jgi:acetylornithine deacetylase/succinyl-diaminopimelate desuccinylase-like protein
MTVSDAIKTHIQAHLEDHIARIKAFVQQPSVSLEKQALDTGAAFVVDALKAIGCADAEVVDLGDGYPGVWGSLDFGRPKTVMIYSHYDVRPVGTEPWSHGPFDGDVVPFAGFSKTILGRGAAAKGPLMGFLMALKAMIDVEGSLPVNVKFLIEGAEILGSPNYSRLVEAKRDQLAGVTAIYGPRATQDGSGTVGFTHGYKGLVYFDLVASSKAWGRGPDGGSIHSSTNVVVDNVAWRLAHALATMSDAKTGEITVPGLEDAVAKRKPIESWEQPLVDDLIERLSTKDANSVLPGLSGDFPVRKFKGDLTGAALAHEYLYGPAMNLSSLRSGYTGPGTKSFLLPHEARTTIDLRLVTDVPAKQLIQIVRDHLDAHGFADIAIEAHAAYDWYQTPATADLITAAVDTLADEGYGHRAWALQAFGGPWAHYGREFGVPSLQGAAPGHGGRGATSDEFYVLEGNDKIAGLLELELHYLAFLKKYAELA